MSIFFDYDQKAKYQRVKLPTLKYIFNVAVMENSMALFQKNKTIIIWSNNPTSEYLSKRI